MSRVQQEDWRIVDPEVREDHLPHPYRLIDQVLKETVLHRLDLSLFELEQQTKDPNYEGTVPEYFSQNCLDLDSLSCLSAEPNSHNHLLAGDKMGTLHLLDLAKKTVFSKRELVAGKRTTYISQSLITDGETSITTAAVILNRHPSVEIVRYRHGQQKLVHSYTVQVGDNPWQYPYACKWDDYSRLLLVFTFAGSILLFRVPEPVLDVDSITRNQTIPLEEEEVRKKLRYPLSYAILEAQVTIIREPLLTLSFSGVKKVSEKTSPIEERAVNGEDNSASYSVPQLQPFALILHSRVELSKKRAFQRGRFIDVPHQLIYGWTGTKEFNVGEIFSSDASRCPEYILVQHQQSKISEDVQKTRLGSFNKKVQVTQPRRVKTISEIEVAEVSKPDEIYLGLGLSNGSAGVWATASLSLLMHTDKHPGPISTITFFEQWKLVTGSQAGSIHIDDLLNRSNALKRTHIFGSRQNVSITHLRTSSLGLCLALNAGGHLRLYDLWRNQKVAKIQASNSFARLQNKGRRWLSGSSLPLYFNHDFIGVLSSHWPSYSARQLEDDPLKKQQLLVLEGNPWGSKTTHLHVIRNFQLLLSLFPGLQATYKRGYDRRKVENLFSNLQFPQLQDRSFQIPDFGIDPKGKGDARSRPHQTSKSSHHPKSKTSSGSPLKETKGMTREVLHPEQFLMERRKVGGLQVLTGQKLHGRVLDGLRRQDALESALQNTLSKGAL